MSYHDVPGQMIRLWWAATVVDVIVGVSFLLTGEVIAAAGFFTAAVTALGAVSCAERWQTWRGVADGLLGHMEEPPDGPI